MPSAQGRARENAGLRAEAGGRSAHTRVGSVAAASVASGGKSGGKSDGGREPQRGERTVRVALRAATPRPRGGGRGEGKKHPGRESAQTPLASKRAKAAAGGRRAAAGLT